MIHARISVSGQVQGVGFRPFVYRLAHELGLTGWVRNDSSGVAIVVEGERAAVMSLIARLQSEPPQLARVEQVEYRFEQAVGMQGFCIAASHSGRMQTAITPDIAICPDCLAELFDPTDRRYLHPFINCIHCGPRYTLTASMPYDRANTSMAKFTQCPACQREYDDPATRRFHAQPNACPVCGPQLRLYDSKWQQIEKPVETAARLIRDGQVVAIKGVGGFHLAFDARNAETVARLRRAKQREEKPFAVMVLNTASADRYAALSMNESLLLASGERPIVLLQKSDRCDDELPGIAPGLDRVGLLLPYTPLHYLLFHALSDKPCGTDWLHQPNATVLVMTSANPGGEPLVLNDVEARESLAGLADAYLTHDRDILQRCDDSVMRVTTFPLQTAGGGGESRFQFIRRARGYTPRRILLPFPVQSVLACGAWLKNTVCITRGNEAFVSQHIGDLDHAGTRAMLGETVAHLCDIYDVQPDIVAHDLHPDFYSSEFALNYAAERGLPSLAVQHHHAHIGAICAEHHITVPVLGLALDGVGLGTDGGAWGGELLRVDGADFQRLGHLAPIAMPGGDRAAKEPWRMAAAALFQQGRGDQIFRRFPEQPGAKMLADMLQRGLNCPPTSSMGRLFDAAAGLLGVVEIQGFKGQAAMLLEGMAAKHGQVAAPADAYAISCEGVLSFSPLLSLLADCRNPAYGAALFHACLANGLIDWVFQAATASNIEQVALGGGCFHNHILSQQLTAGLSMRGLRVLSAQQLPPNDGGVSLGQAWIAGQASAV